MIGNLKYIVVAVPDLALAIQHYQNVFGAFVSSPQNLPDHGIQLAIVKLPNSLLELISPLEGNASFEDFFEKKPKGGVHHLCYEVPNIEKAKEELVALGTQVREEGTPQLGYHGNPVLYLDSKESSGVLIELEQSPASKSLGRVEINRIGPLTTMSQPSSYSLKGVEGVGVQIKVDFKRPTPEDNREGE